MQLRAEDLSRAATAALLGAAAIAHVLSWLLPVLDDYVGWQAFRVALTPIVPYDDFSAGRNWQQSAVSFASGMTNILFVLALGALASARSAWLRASPWVLVAAAILNLYWFVMMGDDRRELRIGYYLWVMSFLLLAGAAHLRARSATR